LGCGGCRLGGVKWLEQEGRIESPTEALEREIWEEVGYRFDQRSKELRPMVVIIPGERKSRVGYVYEFSLDVEEDFNPQDRAEIAQVRFFKAGELIDLVGECVTQFYRPEFNRGMVVWWLRNEHRSAWDPYSPWSERLGPVLNPDFLWRWTDSNELGKEDIYGDIF